MSSEQMAVTSSDGMGGILRAARENKNMELGEIAASINLSSQLLARIENNNFDDIPLVYLRGYVRSYSQALGLDSAPLLSALPDNDKSHIKAAAAERSKIDELQARRTVRRIVITMAILLLASLASYIYTQRDLRLTALNDQFVHSSPLESDDTISGDNERASMADASTVSSDKVVAVEEQVEEVIIDESSLPLWKRLIVYSPFADADAGESVLEDIAGDVLELELAGDCWIEIKDGNGEPLLTKMGSAGESIKLSGELPFSILLGNAPVAAMRFNDEQVDLEPYTKGAIARLYLP